MNERAKIARRVADEAEETKTVLAAYEDEHFKALTARLFADRAVEAVSRLEHLTVEDLCAMTSCEVRVKDAGTRRMLDTDQIRDARVLSLEIEDRHLVATCEAHV